MSTLRARSGVSLTQLLSVLLGVCFVGSAVVLGLGVGTESMTTAGVPVLAGIPALMGLVLIVAAYKMF